MDHYELRVAELGVVLAVAHLAELLRHDRRRLASRIPGRTQGRHRDRAPGCRDSWAEEPRPPSARSLPEVSGEEPRREPCWWGISTSLGCSTPATAGPAPATPACWTTTGRCSSRRPPCGRPTGGRVRPAGAPAWRCGRPAPRSCWPPSPC